MGAIASAWSQRRMSMKMAQWFAAGAVILGAFIFSTAGVYVKLLEMTPFQLAGYRLLVPAVVLWVLLPSIRSEFCSSLRESLSSANYLLMLASLLTTVRIVLWVAGLIMAPMSKAVVVLFTWPILFTVFSVACGRERTSYTVWVLLGLALLGLVLMQGEGGLTWQKGETLGLLCMFAAAILHALNMLIFKSVLLRHNPFSVVFRECLVGCMLLGPVVLLTLSELSATQLFFAFMYGATIGVLGYGLIYYGLQKLKASTVSILAYMEVLSAAFLGVLVFNEDLGKLELVGVVCIVIAVTALRFVKR